MDNQQRNNEQLAKISENSSAIDNVKSITNIYYDCLERIFEFLDLESLLNVANTCKRLQIAAAAYYGNVYGKQAVNILIPPYTSLAPGFFYGNGKIVVNVERELCLPFLRCFGPKILYLTVLNFYDKPEDYYVVRYINQYCAKTLESISLTGCLDFSIENFPNSFEFVEEVYLEDVKLKEQLPLLVNLFPKLRRLEMNGVLAEENCNAAHFPNLENLTIEFDSEIFFSMKNLVVLLHANPQLQKLKLGMDLGQEITINKLLGMISQNPLITKLKLWNSSTTNINPPDLMRFASERPHTVELELPNHRIPLQDAINFIRQLKSLKLFKFRINDQADYDQLVSQLDIEWKHEINFGFNNFNTITLKR